ncbi:MAG TPA: helix-turn-helix domain-containing protein, partial [Candidatus Acidoferrales bacterium]|nr:helix-turn-helix domain-containing protein [Candidatus Acidoferrales bacterium]
RQSQPSSGAAGITAVGTSASSRQSAPAANGTLAERVESFERATILEELRRQNHHMTNVAKSLGLERSHLYKKCQQLGIDLRAVRKTE